MRLTMEDTCLNCGKKQGVNEPYIYYEVENGKHVFLFFIKIKLPNHKGIK